MKIALICAQWHADLVQSASGACIKSLTEGGVLPENILTIEVPGSLEIPLMAKKIISRHSVDAIIGIGWVVDGGIYRHEFVAQAILNGMMQVQLETEVPIFSCVLTPKSFSEDDTHIAFFAKHLVLKGQEVATSCLSFLNTTRQLQNE